MRVERTFEAAESALTAHHVRYVTLWLRCFHPSGVCIAPFTYYLLMIVTETRFRWTARQRISTGIPWFRPTVQWRFRARHGAAIFILKCLRCEIGDVAKRKCTGNSGAH